jgi:hypothetical protein
LAFPLSFPYGEDWTPIGASASEGQIIYFGYSEMKVKLDFG